MEFPDELRYSDDHEWVRVDNDTVVVGISAYAVEQLGDIVFVELPNVGATFATGDTFGVVESSKAASDLFCPAAGEIVETNEAFEERPELVNEDPYGDGWIVRLRFEDAGQVSGLKDAEAYRKMIAEK